MPKPGSPQMRARQPGTGSRDWFRVSNAHVDEKTSDASTTKVYIYDVIGDSWFEDATPANDFVKMLSNIGTPNIELHLNSPGGDIFDGVAIYNALKSHPAKVTVVIDALAASAASFIAQAGDEVIMTKAATMMIHDGAGIAFGDAATMRQTADVLDKLSNTVAGIYADNAGQTTDFWRNLMVEETWYNAEEAVASGLADKIDGVSKPEDVTAQNKWDLSFFNYAGRGAAPDPLVVRQRIANRLKEMTVAGPQNSSNPPEEEVNPSSPDVNPDANTTEGTADEVQKERDVNPGAVPSPPTPGVTEAQNRGNSTVATAVRFKVGDREVVMGLDEAGAKLSELLQFQNETMTQARKDFVKQLAADNKIGAPQIDKLTAYALTLSDDQYTAWKDTYDGAPSLPMLGNSYASGTTNHNGPQSHEVDAAAKELEAAKGIVERHKLAGLSNEKIMQTPSYAKVLQSEPTFKL